MSGIGVRMLERVVMMMDRPTNRVCANRDGVMMTARRVIKVILLPTVCERVCDDDDDDNFYGIEW